MSGFWLIVWLVVSDSLQSEKAILPADFDLTLVP